MLLQIPDVLTLDQLRHARDVLARASWSDGRTTAGPQSLRAKNNLQVPEHSAEARELGDVVLAALQRNATFMSAALPLKIYPPMFNRYAGGQAFGNHVDNAIRHVTGTAHRVRTDVSATLFLENPDNYEGGDLIVEDTYGTRSVKLPAGHLVLYPSTSLHRVTPVTSGARVACFFWTQSLVRDDGRRGLLFEMDRAIQQLMVDHPDHPSALQLTGVYHNLLRQWAEV